MAYTTIKKPSDYFDGKTYLGSASAVTVTGLDFQPDLVWVKDRDNGNNHCLVDAVRGVGKYISSDLTSAETNNATNSISAFNSDGFTTGTANPANEAASTTKGFMSWNWLGANGTASNTDGSIISTVSANTTSGFSIVQYAGSGSTSTVGHGLGVAPSMIIFKAKDDTGNWVVYHNSIGATHKLHLNTTDASATGNHFNNTEPTSSVITLTDNSQVNSGVYNYIAYCFAEKKGFSKFGSYTGNGSTDGTFIYTGFKPSFLMTKRTDTTSEWVIFDNKRDSFNQVQKFLQPDSSSAEGNDNGTSSGKQIDFLSNGWKMRGTTGGMNASGGTYIYMAFADEPLVGDNPATAR